MVEESVHIPFINKLTNFCDPNYNIFYTTANCVTAGVNNNYANIQNSWENLKKSETQKSA